MLVRVIVEDDEQQARAANRTLRRASRVIVTLACLCEVLWVLDRVYMFSRAELMEALEAILEVPSLETNRAAVAFGMTILRAGGDFGDGVIAFEGTQLGGEVFTSFDKKAVSRVRAQGYQAELL